MEFEIPETLANALLGMINEDSPLAKRLSEYGLSRGKRVVPSHLFDATSLNTLYDLCRTANERGLMFQMLALDNIHAAPAARKIPSLEMLIPGLIAWLSRDMIDGWLYKLGKDGVLLPWLVHSMRYVQPVDGAASGGAAMPPSTVPRPFSAAANTAAAPAAPTSGARRRGALGCGCVRSLSARLGSAFAAS